MGLIRGPAGGRRPFWQMGRLQQKTDNASMATPPFMAGFPVCRACPVTVTGLEPV